MKQIQKNNLAMRVDALDGEGTTRSGARGKTVSANETAASAPASSDLPVNPAVSLPLTKVVGSVRRTIASRTKVTDRAPGGKAGSSRGQLTKADTVLKKLQLARGVTIIQLMEVTGWQAHSVRGFLSAVVRRRFGTGLVSEVGRDGLRRYRIVNDGGRGQAE